jgi:threonine/homoserine/homoserine lactone efflux protein
MDSERRLARIAGSLYLVVAVLGGFAELYVRDRIVELGDSAAKAEIIRDSATLFRAGFAADLVQATFFLFTGMALYLLLRHTSELVARAMVVLVAVSVGIICLNLLNQYMALQLATSEAAAFGAAGSDGCRVYTSDAADD